jgi:hypothetical protein
MVPDLCDTRKLILMIQARDEILKAMIAMNHVSRGKGIG